MEVPVDKLTAFFTLMAAMSIATERVVEIIKGIIPSLAATDPDPNKERRRHMILQVLAAVAGMGVAAVGHTQVSTALGGLLDTKGDVWSFTNLGEMGLKYGLVGVMASGGSAMWNHALDIVGALKTGQELKAGQEKKVGA